MVYNVDNRSRGSKMHKVNKKGFTMIELLTAVVILGLFSIVAVITINRIIENGRRNYYEQQRSLILLAGKDYFTTNTDRLPREIGEHNYVTLATLINEQYIGPVYDHLNSPCSGDESVVTVRRNNNNQFEYLAYLVCPNCTEEWCPPREIISGEQISIHLDPSHLITRENIDITVTMSGAVSYRYTVRNLTTSSTRNSGSIAYSGQFIIHLSDVGEYEVVVTARNASGSEHSERGSYIIDRTPPICGAPVQPSPPWTNQATRTLGVRCVDGGLSGCSTETVERAFHTAEGTVQIDGNIRIYDRAGNHADCPVPVRVDRIRPNCGPMVGGTPTWTNQASRTVSIHCNNTGGAPCAQPTFNGTFNVGVGQGLRSGIITIRDVAGNTHTCNADVNIDRIPPHLPVPSAMTFVIAVGDPHVVRGCISHETCTALQAASPHTINRECDIYFRFPNNITPGVGDLWHPFTDPTPSSGTPRREVTRIANGNEQQLPGFGAYTGRSRWVSLLVDPAGNRGPSLTKRYFGWPLPPGDSRLQANASGHCIR